MNTLMKVHIGFTITLIIWSIETQKRLRVMISGLLLIFFHSYLSKVGANTPLNIKVLEAHQSIIAGTAQHFNYSHTFIFSFILKSMLSVAWYGTKTFGRNQFTCFPAQNAMGFVFYTQNACKQNKFPIVFALTFVVSSFDNVLAPSSEAHLVCWRSIIPCRYHPCSLCLASTVHNHVMPPIHSPWWLHGIQLTPASGIVVFSVTALNN